MKPPLVQVQARKRVPAPPLVDLSPIKGSPPASPAVTSAQQNVRTLASLTTNTNQRQPLSMLSPRTRENLPRPNSIVDMAQDTRKVKLLSELTANRNTTKERTKRDSVKDRVREWEREKERLREMERLDELERDRDAQFEAEREQAERQQRALAARERARDKENQSVDMSAVLSPPRPVAPPPTPGEKSVFFCAAGPDVIFRGTSSESSVVAEPGQQPS